MTWKIWMIVPVLSLAACAEETTTDEPASEVAPPTGNAAGPAPRDDAEGGNGAAPAPGNGNGGNGADGAGHPDMVWNFSSTARGPKLTYGVPQTDNVRLTLRCAGGDRVELSFMRGQSGGDRMIVRSGGARETVSSTVEDTELGPYFISAELPADSAPLQRFRGGSPLTVEWSGETRTVPPAGAEAERFFSAC